MEGGLVGRITEPTLVRFILVIVLVWLAVDLGILLAGLFPQLPAGTRTVMAPGNVPGGVGAAPDVHLG